MRALQAGGSASGSFVRPTIMLKALLFDLDETLYHPDSGMLQAGDRTITQYLCDEFGCDWGEAEQLRVGFTHRYGTTAAGVEAQFGTSQADFYAATVEQVDPTHYLRPAPELNAMLAAIPAQLHVFTNATRPYADGVLRALGITAHFAHVFDIEFAGWRPKPALQIYQRAIAVLDLPPEQIGIIEDNPANLVPACDLGMITFLLRQDHEAAHYSLSDILDLHDILCKEKLCPQRCE